MTDVTILGQIRGAIRPFFAGAGTQIQPMLSDGGAAIMTQGLPERAELVRLGASWGAAIPTANAFTYVATWPTTRAELFLYNGEAAGGPSYIVDRVWETTLTAGPTGAVALLGQIVPAVSMGVTGGALANNTAILPYQLSGRSAGYAGNARLVLAQTTLAIANKWFPLGPSANVSVANAITAAGVEANVYGRIIIPPGAGFGVAGLASFAAGTAIAGIEWHEVTLSLG